MIGMRPPSSKTLNDGDSSARRADLSPLTISGYTISNVFREESNIITYQGVRNADGVFVYIKTLKKNHTSQIHQTMLKREYEILRHLESEFVVQAYDLLKSGEQYFEVLEDFGGVSLAGKMNGAMPVDQFLSLAIQICKALAYVHEKRIIHKNINLKNIIYNPKTCALKLIDFTLAIPVTHERNEQHSPILIEGTLPYISPEQTGFMGSSIDQRSDLYALGVTFYEMITGHLPFQGKTPLEWVHCHIARVAPPPHEIETQVPDQISLLIMKLLNKMPYERYQSVNGLKADLEKCLSLWHEEGRISTFPLGLRDLELVFEIPDRIYGRDREINLLRECFERLTQEGSFELCFIEGYAGIGKSSLAQTLEPQVVSKNGLFIRAKIDQIQQDTPYALIVEAVNGLVADLLTLDDQTIAEVGAGLRKALGIYGGSLLNLVPMLSQLTGSISDDGEMPPVENEIHLQLLLQRLFAYFARPEQALVLFLDDLHWADVDSLKLLKFLVSSPQIRHFMIIGAYRSHEFKFAETIAIGTEEGTVHDTYLSIIKLESISEDNACALVNDALHGQKGELNELSKLIYDKTDGNPFYFIQFLQAIWQEGLVKFDSQAQIWHWNYHAISTRDNAHTTIALMADKKLKQDRDIQNMLKVAAVIGQIDIPILASIMGLPRFEIEKMLHEAISLQLLYYKKRQFYFAHDRIREAAYHLIPAEQRASLHLRIAREYQTYYRQRHWKNQIFELVRHYNRGVKLITDESEKTYVARLNLRAGNAAKMSASLTTAAHYFASGMKLLSKSSWDLNRELMFELVLERSNCELLDGQLEKTESLLEFIGQKQLDDLEKIKVNRIWITYYITKGDTSAALEKGRQALQLLKIKIPLAPSRDEVECEYKKFWDRLGQRPIEDLVNLPTMISADMKLAIQILSDIGPSMYGSSQNLAALNWCYMANISLEYGNTEASIDGYCWFGIVCQAMFGRYEDGYRLGQLAGSLMEKYGYIAWKAKYLAAMEILSFWTQPISAALNYVESSYNTACEMGDSLIACFSSNHIVTDRLMRGDYLEDVYHESERRLKFLCKAQFAALEDIVISMQRFIQSMRGLTYSLSSFGDEHFSEAEFEERIRGHQINTVYCWHQILKMTAHFMAEDFEAAHTFGLEAQNLLWSSMGLPQVFDFYYYYGLTLAGLYDRSDDIERLKIRDTIYRHEEILARWASVNPRTFADKHALLAAELARVEGREREAMTYYENAIQYARQHKFIQNEALSYDLAARFYLKIGFKDFAVMYLKHAREAYSAWGAFGKVVQLDHNYPFLVNSRPESSFLMNTYSAPVQQFDMESILAVSQAISGEIILPHLIHIIMEQVITLAGADTAILALMENGGLEIVSQAKLDEQGISIEVLAEPLNISESSDQIPLTVLNYVSRLKKKVLIQHALQAHAFSSDEVLKLRRPRSLLCFPAMKHGKFVGLIYLENHVVDDAFTAGRINTLEVLASQMAISIENALLYTRLQQQAGRLEAIVTSIADAVVVYDNEGRVILSNEAAEDLKVSELISSAEVNDDDELLPHTTLLGEEVVAHDSPLIKALHGGEKATQTLKMKFNQGGKDLKYIQINAAPVKDDQGESIGTVAIVRDLTELIELDLLKDQFLRVAAHELKTPIAIIKGYTQILKRQIRGVEGGLKKVGPILEKIVRGSDRLSELVNALFDVSLLQLGKLNIKRDELDLVDIVRESVQGLEAITIGRAIHLKLIATAPIRGDWVRLNQVINNLLSNAVKYSPEDKDLEVEVFLDGDQVVVAVKDQGVGIEKSKQSHIFEHFYQAHIDTSHDFGGLGVGLFIAREIIRNLDGDIWLDSEEGKGSIFYFSLPLRRDSHE